MVSPRRTQAAQERGAAPAHHHRALRGPGTPSSYAASPSPAPSPEVGSPGGTISRGYCFYLDLRSVDIARTLSKRIEDLSLRQELFLTERVTHVISDRPCETESASGERAGGVRRRADAMLERVCTNTPQQNPLSAGSHVTLTVQKAVILLDKIYDTIYKAIFPQVSVKVLKGDYIKFEPIDRTSRPVYKEFTSWPEIPKEPECPASARGKREEYHHATQTTHNNTNDDRMTRKNRPRIKEETKELKGGFCEMCSVDYADAALHRRSPHHLAFVRDSNNFKQLDSLIESGVDVAAFLDKNGTPVNGERRSLRKLCNGDVDRLNGAHSPLRTNGLDDEGKKRLRTRKRSLEDDKQYYKVVGVSTKLRSSGGFAAPRKDSPVLNGKEGLVVKFRKIRRSELSVLSDEAEQFMFPRRASTSSSSEDEEAPPPLERRRSARPTALKEDSSDEDSAHDVKSRRKRAPPAVKLTPAPLELEPVPPAPVVKEPETPDAEEPKERCLKWEEGRLKAAPIVEELQFAFESVPNSEPWYETFKRQDQEKQISRNIPRYFAMYTTSPKLPYEIGQLPPLKPNCCALSELVKREDKAAVAGPSRSYGTRGNKKQRIRNRTVATLIAIEKHPRKSPREHASTLAMLGGLLHRRKHADDAKSTASEDTSSDATCHVKTEARDESERMQQFMSEVYDDIEECEVPEDIMDGEATIGTSAVPDVVSLVSECENCHIIRDEVRVGVAARGGRKGRFKKKNRTGWPNKKKVRQSSEEVKNESLVGEASTAHDIVDESTHDSASCDDSTIASADESIDEKPLLIRNRKASTRCERVKENATEGEASADEGAKRWEDAALQPVVRVAKIDPEVGRKLRSAGRSRGTARRSRAYRFR